MKTVAIIGASGQLGTDLMRVFGQNNWQMVPLTHKQIEISDRKSVNENLDEYQPDMVINTAAVHNLDECELDFQRALAVNTTGVKHLVDWCGNYGATLVHISTDYVFGGDGKRHRPYAETDPVAPQSSYAISKAAGEFWVKNLKKFFLIRTCGLYGVAGSQAKAGNFVDKRITQATRGETIYMVSDQLVSPTYTLNLAENMAQLLATKKYGTYHMTSQGACSWYEFTQEILQLMRLKAKVMPVKTQTKPGSPVRPRYSVLTNRALKRIGLDHMRHWRENLKLYLQEKCYLS